MELILALACEEARVRPDGKLDILGVFNELSAPGFPATQDRMTVAFVLEWGPEDQGRQPLRADLVDQDEQKILTIQGHTDVEARGPDRAPAQTRLVLPLERVIFPHAGRYHFEITAGETKRRALSIFLREIPQR
jgi:hypothetical protein